MIRWLEKRRFFSFVLFILISIQIFYLSSLSSEQEVGGYNLFPLIYHFCAFFLFTIFLFITITGKKRIKIKHLFIILIISLIYAASDEFHQLFVPNRNGSFSDFLIDSFGILFSILIYNLSKRKAKR